jgi:hypothetical protein
MMLIQIRNTIFVMIKGMATVGLGGVVLWQAAIHARYDTCIAYVHVSMINVEVAVDDSEYRIESLWQSPIVCELAPGRHMLRMYQTGRVVYEEEFTLENGQQVVLTAGERPKEAPVDDMPLSDPANLADSSYQHAQISP